MSPSAVKRLFNHARELGIDERLGSQIGLLVCARQLTPYHAAVGFRIAAIYGRFEREHGKRRSVRSPSYEISYGEGPVWSSYSEIGADAERDFFGLQALIPGMWRATVEQLCVEDRAVSTMVLDHVRAVLEDVGHFLNMDGNRRMQRAPTQAAHGNSGIPLHFNAHEAEPADSSSEPTPPAERKRAIDEIYWIEVVGRLRPDLSTEDLARAYRMQSTLKDRAAHNRSLRKIPVPLSERHRTKLGKPVLTLPVKDVKAS